MKRILSLLLVVVLGAALFAGCTKEEPAKSEPAAKETTKEAAKEEVKEEEKMVIGYATKSSTSPFWVTCNEGALQAAEDYGVELIMLGPPKENDVVGQLAVLEDMLNREVNGLVIAPCDSVGVGPAVERAGKADVPVIALGDPIEGPDVTSLVTTDNYAASSLAAHWMAEQLGEEGKIVLLNGMIAQGGGKQRYEGFRDTVESDYPNMEIIFAKDCGWVDEEALKAMEDAVAAYDQIDGIFVGWDGAALAAHTVLTEAGRIDDTVICGFDCYPQSLKFMKEGTFEGNVAQSPYKMGYMGVETAILAARGETVTKFIDTGVLLVTPENVDEYIADNDVVLPD